MLLLFAAEARSVVFAPKKETVLVVRRRGLYAAAQRERRRTRPGLTYANKFFAYGQSAPGLPRPAMQFPRLVFVKCR